MVGRDNLKDTGLDPAPKKLLVDFVSRYRCTEVLCSLPAGLAYCILGHEQILRTGLAINLDSTLLTPADLLGRITGRDVNDEYRYVDYLPRVMAR